MKINYGHPEFRDGLISAKSLDTDLRLGEIFPPGSSNVSAYVFCIRSYMMQCMMHHPLKKKKEKNLPCHKMAEVYGYYMV